MHLQLFPNHIHSDDSYTSVSGLWIFSAQSQDIIVSCLYTIDASALLKTLYIFCGHGWIDRKGTRNNNCCNNDDQGDNSDLDNKSFYNAVVVLFDTACMYVRYHLYSQKTTARCSSYLKEIGVNHRPIINYKCLSWRLILGWVYTDKLLKLNCSTHYFY
jgi:hypothetical protein